MLRKNLPLYILVVLTLAALIFLSPKIIGIISADTNEPIRTGKEILVNNKFDLEPLNNQIWLTAAANTNSMVTSSPDYVSATCGKAEGDFVKISQKAPVSAGKFYKLSISYINEPNASFGKAQFGFLKDGPTANVIESKSIDFAAGSSEFVAYAAPKLNHENSYFFFKCTGIGTIKIKNLSLEEFQIMPAAMITTTVTSAAQTAQSAQNSVTRTPAPSATPSLSTTATPSQTPSPTPTPNNTPAQTTSAELISQAPPAEQTTILSGWNILGNSEDVSSELFTSKNMTAMQMLGGKWIKLTPSSKKATVLSKSGGIYIFNPSKSSKYVSRSLKFAIKLGCRQRLEYFV